MDNTRLEQIITEAIVAFCNAPYVEVGISNRHIHLSQSDLEALFGAGYVLTPMKELTQPGQYACRETVDVVGRKGRLKNVRILGPVRKETQVEVSVTDSFTLGISAPVHESGVLDGAGEVILENPGNGARVVTKGAIAALRHIHLRPDYAEKFGLRDKQMVSVSFDSPRGILFPNVLLRVSPQYENEMHVDTDEANAGGIKTGDMGLIVLDV